MAVEVKSTYRGYIVITRPGDFLVIAPNGDTRRCVSTSAIRRWVKDHRKAA